MKKFITLAVLWLVIATSLCGCFRGIMFIPSNDSIGEPKQFTKDGMTITLTDEFQERPSKLGFDAYYTSDFCGVVVLKEPFTLEEGLKDRSLETYIQNVIINNGHTNVKPKNIDGLWYYKSTSDTSCNYSYTYKGSDAFWIVQFICRPSDEVLYKDLFYLWAETVEIP